MNLNEFECKKFNIIQYHSKIVKYNKNQSFTFKFC